MIMHGSRNFWLSASCTHTNKTHSTIKSIPSNNIKEFDVVAYKKIQGLRMKTIRKLYFWLSLTLICFEVSWHFVACERSKKFIEKYISYVVRISIYIIFMYHNLCMIDIQIHFFTQREDPDISCETTMVTDIETPNYCEEPKWYYNIMNEEDVVLRDKLVPEVKLTTTAQDHTIPR